MSIFGHLIEHGAGSSGVPRESKRSAARRRMRDMGGLFLCKALKV